MDLEKRVKELEDQLEIEKGVNKNLNEIIIQLIIAAGYAEDARLNNTVTRILAKFNWRY